MRKDLGYPTSSDDTPVQGWSPTLTVESGAGELPARGGEPAGRARETEPDPISAAVNDGGDSGREDAPTIAAGSVIRHYEIIRLLGSGGMGTVFLARDTCLARLVAIKLITEYRGERSKRF